MTWLKRLGLWIKKNWKWIIGTLGILSAIIGLYWTKRNLKEFLIQKKQISLQKKKRDIQALETKKEIIKVNINHTEEQIKKVEDVIKEIDKSIKRGRSEISTLTRGEKLDKFDEFGY